MNFLDLPFSKVYCLLFSLKQQQYVNKRRDPRYKPYRSPQMCRVIKDQNRDYRFRVWSKFTFKPPIVVTKTRCNRCIPYIQKIKKWILFYDDRYFHSCENPVRLHDQIYYQYTNLLKLNFNMEKQQAMKFFADFYGGEHHIPGQDVHRYGDGWNVIHNRGPLSTFDTSQLTKLVLMAHDRCMRIEIGPGKSNTLIIAIHQRKDRHGPIYERHPDIATAIEEFNSSSIKLTEYGSSEEEQKPGSREHFQM